MPQPGRPPLVTDRPVEVKEGGYIGSASCRACHRTNHDSWTASYHRTMTQVATPESVVGEFDGVERRLTGKFRNAHLERDGLRCRLDRRGDEFWVSMDDLSVKDPNKVPDRVERRVVMTTGSHHMQVYWYASGKTRLLGQVPYVYLIGEHRWIPRRAAFLTDPARPVTSEEARWNGQCIACHTTGGIPKPTRDYSVNPPRIAGADTRAAEFGISCEACHGPGGDHVATHRSRDDLADGAHITNPENLSPRLASQVCGQCHSINAFDSLETRLAYIDQGAGFRPGGELEESGVFIMKRSGQEDHPTVANLLRADPHTMDGYFWGDGMVRVSGREYNGLLESPCYTHGDESRMISCLSCHSLHKGRADKRPLAEWADDQLDPGALGNSACTQCHGGLAAESGLAAHTFHLADSTGSSCYNCHMPHTSYGLLKAIRSHTISSPSARESIEVGRPNACNQCHLDKSLGWVADKLADWYRQPRPVLTPVQESVPASLVWLFRGDAGQRALSAWAMGWDDARQTSGTDWIPGALLPLLNDPYEAVRLIAWRGLRKDPRLHGAHYDFLAAESERFAAIREIRQLVGAGSASGSGPADPGELIDDPDGEIGDDILEALLKSRDDRPVSLVE